MVKKMKCLNVARMARRGCLIFVIVGFFFQFKGNVPTFVVDADHDGLIEIKNAAMLNNIRYNLAGTSYKTSVSDAGDSSGCPPVVQNGSGGCHGYELSADIDLLSLLDANKNGMIDKTTTGIDKNADGDTTDAGEQRTVINIGAYKDKSWVPISTFTGTFEGNDHTIANLWVNVSSSDAGLFGITDGTLAIRNVGVISGSIHSSSSSGGLVGASFSLTITNSYWNTDAPQSIDGGTTAQNPRAQGSSSTPLPPGATGLTFAQLKATSGTYPSGLPSGTATTKSWDLGSSSQLPAIKLCVSPTVVPPSTQRGKATVTCASYGALLTGQR